MKTRNTRNHPVRQLLDHLTIGGTLTSEDLQEIRFPDDVDRAPIDQAIRAAAGRIAELRAAGERGLARRHAAEAAHEIIAAAGAALPKQREYPDDPAGLAALMPRRWTN